MRILEELGRGGFGVVQRVETPDGRVCARKLFVPDEAWRADAADERLPARFRREVRIQRSISHPNIVPVLDADLGAAPPWFTMPLAVGTLRQRILADRHHGGVTVAPLWDVLAGLEALHTKGFVHRDLKPANVLLLGAEWAVSDFGLARAEFDDGSARTDRAHGYGTKSYMSPEQYRRFHSASTPTDIFAFGCILHDIFGDDLRMPYQQCTVPGDLATVAERCTAVAESDRYADVAALRMAMLDILQSGGLTSVSDVIRARRASLHAHPERWTPAAWRRLITWLTEHASPVERHHILSVVDLAQLEHVRVSDPLSWDRLARLICTWLRGLRSPGAALADAGAARLRHFVAHGDPGVQTEAMIALLDLARHARRAHVTWQWQDALRAPLCAQFASRLARALESSRVAAAAPLALMDPLAVEADAIPSVLHSTLERLRLTVSKAG